MIESQDFEAYARQKTFNFSVSEGWNNAFFEALSWSGVQASDARMLDYGCGDGKYFQHLLETGLSLNNIHGIEVSQLRIDRCRALGWNHAVRVENGASLPYERDYFDVVNMMEVIEHIPGTAASAALQEIHRVLRPTGVLIVSTPNYPIKRFYDLYDAVALQHWKRLRDDPTHVSFYNHARLTRLLTRYFARIEERPFKSGFLYRRLVRSRYVKHKMLFLCSRKRIL